MTPIGPYKQELGLSTGNWFIVSDFQHGQIVYVIVQNGQQRHEGTPSPTLKDAKSWLKDNGFILTKSNCTNETRTC